MTQVLGSIEDASEVPNKVQRQPSGNFLSRVSVHRSRSLHPDKATRNDSSPRHPGQHHRQSMRPAVCLLQFLHCTGALLHDEPHHCVIRL